MIVLTALENELAKEWPMQPEGTKAKWLIIQKTFDSLNKIAQIREHSAEETVFVSKYHELRSSFDLSFFIDIENDKYEIKFLPLDLAKRIHSLYTSIDHS